MAQTRIIDLTEASALQADDYLAADSTRGTRKVKVENTIDTTLTQTGKYADAKSVGDKISELKADLNTVGNIIPLPEWRDGSLFNWGNVQAVATKYVIDVRKFKYAHITLKFDIPEGYSYGIEYSTFSTFSGSTIDNTSYTIRRNQYVITKDGAFDLTFEDGENGFAFALYADNNGTIHNLRIANVDVTKISICLAHVEISKLPELENKINTLIPSLTIRNGSELNPASASAIAPNSIIDVIGVSNVAIIATFDLPDNYVYGFQFTTFSVRSGNPETSTDSIIRRTIYVTTETGVANITIEKAEKGFAFSIWAENKDTAEVYPLRTENIDTDKITLVLNYGENEAKVENTVNYKNENARHIIDPSVSPLTLLHFSDLHKDVSALNRIIEESEQYNIDDIICTGDMVANTYEQITGWWNPKVMTVIGNHDTASYSNGSYNWTALSMSDRDSYYISPFKANWNIVHTNGTSYYYKDYPTAKVRLIVLDVMLYNSPGSESEAQTNWLGTLIDGAKTLGYHVLIACHTASGRSTAVECTFSGLDWKTMPTYTDCNLPDDIINLVKTKIADGCVFIGYLCGHFHQDMIWEKENQYAYLITCAAVSQTIQWAESDQYRDNSADAYNLFTVDTQHGLVKIVRGGGADADLYMRPRKMICFDYINHRLIGEEK